MDFIEIVRKSSELDKQTVELIGFVRTNRNSAKIGFLSLNDGTTFDSIQVVYSNELENFKELSLIRIHTAVKVIGTLVLTPNSQQPFEVKANSVEILKETTLDYPLQKKEHSVEFLREIAHLRPRTTTFSSVMRVRSELANAIHKFFHNKNFVWVSSPIITSNDGEGAGECFNVTTNDIEPFFGRNACLSVTGQLQAEAYAQAFKKVYTFGPTFRAEKSHTSRHGAEFWMMEPEVAFCDLNGIIDLMQEMIVFLAKYYKENCESEINFFNKLTPELNDRLNSILENQFAKISYTEVIEILQNALKNGVSFEDNNVFWGMDLASEHEKYICEVHFNKPTFVYNYPKEIKAFYMKQNDDNKTVAAVDLLVPGIGELIGGSQREDSYEKLLNRCNELKMDIEPLS
ncbi:MAG: asparagine--tRNA ligase, partial [Ureaplasma sp.]|nr:asparagine--tRNA ligase [Ureaplasma sp.]